MKTDLDTLSAQPPPAGIFAGIFTDVITYPTPDQVFEALGDKVVHGLAEVIDGARADLAEFRRVLPPAASRASNRGLKNFIHDAMWDRARTAFDDLPEVSMYERNPIRDIFVGNEWRIRLKAHSRTGAIRSYPTQGALDFVHQEPDLFTLLGIRTWHLTVGYEWDGDTRSMGSSVMSLRDGSFEQVIWLADLPAAGGPDVGTVAPITPIDDAPSSPVIEVPNLDTKLNQPDEGTDQP